MSKGKDKVLQIFLRKLKENFGSNVKRVILFGSRARGDFEEFSDYDLLVVFKKLSKEVKDSLIEIEGEMLYEYGAVFSAFPLSEADLKKMKFEPFLINAQKEGVVL